MLVQISDPHLQPGPAGDAAAAALESVVAEILALPFPPAAVLISGDLADDGLPESYARVKDLVAPITSPIYAIPGNHDDPAALAEAFGDETDVEVAGMRLLLCSTHIPGSDAGALDVAALEASLDARPTIVAFHHPPLITGVEEIDRFGLDLRHQVALASMLKRSPQIKRVVCGHVHRVTFQTLGGVGVFTCPATFEQAEPAPGGGLRFVERGRGFALHTWLRGDVVSQIQPV